MTRWLELTRSTTVPLRRRSAMLPWAMRPPPCSTRRISASEVTDLPEPDSPTMARVSPRSTWKDRLRTASTVRSEPTKRTVRSSTWTTRLSGIARLLARSTIFLQSPKLENSAARLGRTAVPCASLPPQGTPRALAINGHDGRFAHPAITAVHAFGVERQGHIALRVHGHRPPLPSIVGSLSITTLSAACARLAPAYSICAATS